MYLHWEYISENPNITFDIIINNLDNNWEYKKIITIFFINQIFNISFDKIQCFIN